LLDLEKEVINLAQSLGDSRAFPAVSPEQLHGIEINPYAHELAQVTVWIGYIQWLRENGFGVPSEPILKPLHNILLMDAILAYDEQGKPVEPKWPEADVITGNPPFLGGKRLRRELGEKYVDDLFTLYENRVSHEADLVCYWFEQARKQIVAGCARRIGLLATNSIRVAPTDAYSMRSRSRATYSGHSLIETGFWRAPRSMFRWWDLMTAQTRCVSWTVSPSALLMRT
jgi:hypothetical protein